MLSLDDNFYNHLCSILTEKSVPPLLNSSDEYRAFRKLIAEANAINRSWLQEPEAEAASALQKKMNSAWQTCHQWLLNKLHNDGLWCPEWFGWLAYTGCYNSQSVWQSVALSFRLLDQYLQHMIVDEDLSLQESLCESLKRLGAIISDDNKEPLLLPPLLATPLLHELTLVQLRSTPAPGQPDGTAIANLTSLNALSQALEKIPEHAQRIGVPITTKTIRAPIAEAIAILRRSLPAQGETDAQLPDLPDTQPADSHDGTPPAPGQQSPMNRERARTDLQHLITFFRHSEPHSPVSWQLETALNCLDLSFPQLLSRMAGEEQQLRQDICRRLGMDDSPTIEDK